jgi:hypothetical protein
MIDGVLYAYADDDGTLFQQDCADYADAPLRDNLGTTEAVECSLSKESCKACCASKFVEGSSFVGPCVRKCVERRQWNGDNKPTPPPPSPPQSGAVIIGAGNLGYWLCKQGLTRVLRDPKQCMDLADRLCAGFHIISKDNCIKTAYGMCVGVIAIPKC